MEPMSEGRKCPECEVIHWEDNLYCWKCQAGRIHKSENEEYREHVEKLREESNKEGVI